MKFSKQGDLWELALVLVFALAPMWLMAGDWSDMDEAWKSGGALACVSSVVIIYRLWKGHREES